jgi:pimeloyl-ACP methyl ester carboxylesterase
VSDLKSENSIPNTAFKRIKRFILGLFFFVFSILLIGFTYHQISLVLDEKNYPETGKLVDVGDHKLHINCEGSGSPTVILESGLWDFSVTWGLVQPEVANTTRVCSYDRAGLGWSDAVTQMQDSEKVAKSLHTLLSNAGEKAPYIMVGHSMGGIHIRSFYRLFQKDVAGMILVDSSHEQQKQRFSVVKKTSPQRKTENSNNSLLDLLEYLEPVGVVRGLANYKVVVPPEQMGVTVANWSKPKFLHALRQEQTMSGILINQSESPDSLGNLPLTVLSRGIYSAHYNATSKKETWKGMQRELAGLSSNSEHIIAEQSGHMIQFNQPELITSLIQKMVKKLRLLEEQS